MENKIVSYEPKRDRLGKFKPSRKTYIKTLFVIVSMLSMYLNYWQAKQWLNIKCSEGGYLVTKAKCNELAQLRIDAQEGYRLQVLEDNSDLWE